MQAFTAEDFQSAFEYAVIGKAIVSPDGKWLKVNRSLCAMLGYSEAELFSLDFQSITHPDDLGSDMYQVQQMLAGAINNYRMEKRYTHKNGSIIWALLSVSLVRHADGTPKHFISQIQDITENKQIMESLRQSEQRFERALRGSHDGIYDWNVVTNDVYYSPRFIEMLGYKYEDFGQSYESWASILHPDDFRAVMNKIEAHLKHRAPYIAEYRLRNRFGHYIWIEATGQAEWNDQGKPVRMSGVMTDISERKRLEHLKRDFVNTVTHELRTPLTALKGALDMLNYFMDGQIPDQAHAMLSLAIKGSDRLALLVDDLLDAGRLESGQVAFNLQPTRLHQLLFDSIDMNRAYADKYGVRYRMVCHTRETTVNVDPVRLQQVMSNLLSNAAKHSPKNGEVTVSLEESGDMIRVNVSDHGDGVPEHFRKKMFEPFARGSDQAGGSGLGLNISKSMIERMDGSIGFDSVIGKGSTFFFELPMHKA